MASRFKKPTSEVARRSRNGSKSAEPDIPPAPPPALQPQYLSLSWRYVYWCVGMLAWSILCVVYFILTQQRVEMIIGICLGLLLIAMITLPTVLFGGETWHKRLAWMTLLLTLFSLMFIYPLVVVVMGITQRFELGRYRTWQYTDVWHLILSVLTVAISIWTIFITVRAIHLVRALYKGEIGVTDIRVRSKIV